MSTPIIEENSSGGETPLISVITVCLNAAEFIEQCMQSVLEQDFDDFEYVVIDGGSTDGSVDMIQKYQDRLAYWHSRPDRGLAHAFNLGVRHSSGKWLLFLNSDDFLVSPSVLSEMAEKLKHHPEADVVFGQVEVVSREVRPVHVGGPYGKAFQWKRFLRRDTIPHQSAFTNRSYFSRVGLFDEAFRIAVDYEHFLRGGAKLRAVCVSCLVCKMREGGMGKKYIHQSLREWKEAQIRSGGRNRFTASMECYLLQLKVVTENLWRMTGRMGKKSV